MHVRGAGIKREPHPNTLNRTHDVGTNFYFFFAWVRKIFFVVCSLRGSRVDKLLVQYYTHRVPGLDEGRHEDPDGVVHEKCGGDDADGEPQRLVVHLSVASFLFLLLSRDVCARARECYLTVVFCRKETTPARK